MEGKKRQELLHHILLSTMSFNLNRKRTCEAKTELKKKKKEGDRRHLVSAGGCYSHSEKAEANRMTGKSFHAAAQSNSRAKRSSGIKHLKETRSCLV